MPAPVLQFKRGNAGVAGTVPALRPGEPAISLNNFDFFIGIDTSVANNKFFGSHRYWGREDGTNSLKLKLVDKNGSNYVAIKSPDTLGGIVTYTLPGTQGGNQTVLTNDGSGNLSWSSGSLNAVFSGITTIGGDFLDVNVNSDFSGITTFSNTTDNTLGNPDTGAVQIDGGLGVNKNVTVGAGLSVVGESYFIGTATFYGGQLNLGDSDTDNISVAGEFVSNLVPNATNTYDLGLTGKRWRNGFYSGNVDITGNLIVDGTATIGGGTTVILYGQDVYIQNKDIILGYTTSITGADASTDDTANHAGVAIASTVGSPLTSFAASGINTLPDTYKQMMWFHAGTLGFGTDAFAFNYGVAIGTTTMADGVRLAVGTGVTVGDTSVSATNFYGNASSANQVKTVTASDTNATYHITFVDSHNGSATNETVYTDDGIYYNPGANKLTTQHAEFTGDVVVSGITSLGGNVNLGNSGSDLITVVGVTTFTTSNVYINNQLYVGGLQITGGASITGEDITARHLNLSGIATVTGLIDGNGGLDITGHSELDDVNVSGATTVTSLNATGNVTLGDTSGDTITVKGTATFEQTIVGTATTANRAGSIDVVGVATNQNYYITLVDGSGNAKGVGVDAELLYNPNTNTFTVGTGVGITQFSSSVSIGTSTSSVPTSSAVIDYVNAADIGIAGNTGTGTVNTTQTLTVAGTASEIETSASGQTITVGLPDAVVVGTSLSAPTLRAGTIQSSNTGATAITITANDVTIADDLTVGGNLYVNGNTTQVNTTAMTVEDRTIELGVVDGSAPSTTTTWDLGVLFNYYDGSAKKSAVVWEQGDQRFKLAGVLGADSNGTNNTTPQLTVTTFAPIEVSELWINNTCTGGASQVIACSGAELVLQNITVDAGVF
jgi:hypothetical protein